MRPSIALFSPALYFSHSASMNLFRVIDGLACFTTGTEEEAIDSTLFQKVKLRKEVERSRRSVERRVCALKEQVISEHETKGFLKLLCLENILRKSLSTRSTNTKSFLQY